MGTEHFLLAQQQELITMTSVPIDCSNLWGEGDEGGSDSDIPAIDDTPTTPTTFPVLPCHCSNLSELSKFVTQLGTPFHNTYRLQKPVLLTDFVTHWNIFNTNGDIDMIDTLRERMALHSRTTVHCLYANDNTHFFGNGLCTSHELTLQDVLRASVMRASPDRPFYCRMRPIPTEVWPLFNLEFQSLLPASQHETSGMLFKSHLCACWIGCQGTVTPLHFDTCHGLLAVVQGTKRVTLFPPEDTMYLYRDAPNSDNPHSSQCDYEIWRDGSGSHPRYPSKQGATSYRSKFSRMEETSPVEILVNEGEMLYIPPGWWHVVENVTSTMSVLLPFDMSGVEDLHESLLLL